MKFEASPSSADAVSILEKIAKRPKKIKARKINKKLAIYGAGKLGRMAIEYLDSIGIKPDIVIDSNLDIVLNDMYWNDKNVISPDEVSDVIRASYMLVVSIVTLPFEMLAGELAKNGWIDIVPFYDVTEAYKDLHPLSNGWILEDFSKIDLEQTQEVLRTWGDDVSRAHHLQFLAWHKFHEDWMFSDAPIVHENRYFIPEIIGAMGQEEYFLDVGAHMGEVTENFLERTQSNFNGICMIEPDYKSYAKIKEKFFIDGNKRYKDVQLLSYAVAEFGGKKLFYSGLGYASQLSYMGADMVSVTTIDRLKLEPTFIKLHLEGAELDALKGAVETIKSFEPILAVTTYHNYLGVWQLPMWLINQTRSMGLSYKFFLRLHGWCGTGAVLYAIPNRRLE